MDTAELRRIAERSTGNTFNDYRIRNIENFNPNARVANTFHFVPVKPMFITKIINKLSDPSFPTPGPRDFDFKRYKIHEKEDYNELRRWKYDIKMYAPYRKKVDEIYASFGDMGQYKRERVYNWLHHEYERLHDSLKADELFDALKDFVSEKVNRDVTLFDTIDYEEMEGNVCIVLVDAFIECQIFEKPE